MKQTKLLVSGATGLSGSLIMQALSAGETPVKALIRDHAKAASLNQLPCVETVVGDMADKHSLKPVLKGVERVVLISTSNEHMVETQCSFIDACKEAGVQHVIKFSGEESQQNYDPSRFRYTREHRQIEPYLENSGLAWTHVRPSQFMQVYLREIPFIQKNGALRLPLEQISMSPVDLQDVAKVIARILTSGGYEGKVLRMTGPQALAMADIAGIISKVSQKAIPYEAISWPEREAQLSAAGLPGYLLTALAEQTAERVRNPHAFIDLSTHELFGVNATTFQRFANRHSNDFSKV